jgi:hypothetical protein
VDIGYGQADLQNQGQSVNTLGLLSDFSVAPVYINKQINI